MATLVFTALGSALGGPVGGAIGSLLGQQIDRAIIGSPGREGPRLKELAVSTSSYGSPLARHFGTTRAAGSIIWSTDLVENRETTGGSKGRPSTTSYSYSISFAVALASRPISQVGRIWADGHLLRGAAGDLKTAGSLRIYDGHGDQAADPLIASAQGPGCPAFRGLAYCVFEALDLGDFGNRIPALTFEIVADERDVAFADLLEGIDTVVESDRPLAALAGFSDEGGGLARTLATIDQLYPLACDAGGATLSIRAAEILPSDPATLPEAAVSAGDDAFGGRAGQSSRRQADARAIPDRLRYYDPARDYQAGMQRVDGRARSGLGTAIEFPGALGADDARALVNAAADRAGWASETLSWRMAELDPALSPGVVVRVPGQAGYWRIEGWEWRETGIELELRRMPRGPARAPAGDSGDALAKPDRLATPTVLVAYELPWDGQGSSEERQVFAAPSSISGGWSGAALYSQRGDDLVPLGGSGPQRSVIGSSTGALAASPALRFAPRADLLVDLLSPDFVLSSTDMAGLAAGNNRALLGEEILQFAQAEPLGNSAWRLTGLLRGRGGTEAAAMRGHAANARFILLDDAPLALDSKMFGEDESGIVVALSLADAEPVAAPLVNPGATRRPLTPVHPVVSTRATGGLDAGWTRRARGAWTWPDAVNTPLNEQIEMYRVGLGPVSEPLLVWETAQPQLSLGAGEWSAIRTQHSGQSLWVRQIGAGSMSAPLLLTIVA